MKNIAKRLNTYITAHSFDPGDSDCETILDRKNASATSPKAFLEGLKYGAHFMFELHKQQRYTAEQLCANACVNGSNMIKWIL